MYLTRKGEWTRLLKYDKTTLQSLIFKHKTERLNIWTFTDISPIAYKSGNKIHRTLLLQTILSLTTIILTSHFLAKVVNLQFLNIKIPRANLRFL